MLAPSVGDDGRYLTCRAESVALHNTVMEDQWELQVQCEFGSRRERDAHMYRVHKIGTHVI